MQIQVPVRPNPILSILLCWRNEAQFSLEYVAYVFLFVIGTIDIPKADIGRLQAVR